MKRIVLLLSCLVCGITSFGQTIEENVIRQFGSNLHDWCSTKDIDYRMRAQMQCVDACRVEDVIMRDFSSRSDLNLKNFVMQSYLNGFEMALNNGPVYIDITNMKAISKEQWSNNNQKSSKSSNLEKLADNFVIFKCDIVVSGALNYNIQDTYYISRGLDAKIVKITPYVEEVDKKTGEKKVIVDFEGLNKYIKKSNKFYPMQISRGVFALKEYVEGNTLFYLYEIDEDYASFKEWKDRASKWKNSRWYTRDIGTFNKLSMVINCNLQIIERFISKQTKESYDIVTTKDELIQELYSIKSNTADIVNPDSIIWENAEKWKKAIAYYLRIDSGDNGRIVSPDEYSQVFLFQNEIDRKFYKQMKMPVITITLINETTGSSKKTRKSIKDLPDFLRQLNVNNASIKVPKIEVYLVDALAIKSGDFSYINSFFIEHIFAIDNYVLTGNRYVQQGREEISTCIERGRTIVGNAPFRAEDRMLKEDNVITIFGDTELNIYYK